MLLFLLSCGCVVIGLCVLVIYMSGICCASIGCVFVSEDCVLGCSGCVVLIGLTSVVIFVLLWLCCCFPLRFGD